jgi:hypothetical protein
MNKNLTLFTKYLKNKKIFLTLNLKDSLSYSLSGIGKTKYLPPASKEWKNSFYAFNPNKLKNLPLYDLNVNSLIKNYFKLYFNNKFIFSRYIPRSFINLSFNKIYVSKAEIKHTNNKALLTVYVYNREKISILKKIKLIKNSFYKDFLKEIWKELYIFFYTPLSPIPKKFFDFQSKLNWFNLNLILLRKYKLRLNLNKSKFEEKLLFKLNNLILKFYKKKVEFNIVNMKSIIFNSDLFTKILTQNLKDKNNPVLNMMDIILQKATLPDINRIIETSPNINNVDLNLLENKYKSFNLTSILIDNNLSEILNKILYNVLSRTITSTGTSADSDFNFDAEAAEAAKTAQAINFNLKKNYVKIYDIIFNSINYKNLGGIRLEVKGRLTKRNRADRALFKVKWKGGLKNIDSSYKGLSSVNMRGYVKPNVQYSIFTSKRRIGAFAVKGWISGK